MIDDELEQMRRQLAHGHEHAHNPQQTEHGQQLAGDAPGGLTWVEFIQKLRQSLTGDSTLERLRSLPDEQQQEQERQEEQDKSRDR